VYVTAFVDSIIGAELFRVSSTGHEL